MLEQYRRYFRDRGYLLSVTWATVLLLASFVVNFFAGTYAQERASNYVTDIVLSNTPVFDVDGIFIYGAIIFWVFIGLLLIRHPRWIPFTFKSIALFVTIRAVFISLTHIAPFPLQQPLEQAYLLKDITFGADLFFSGHTGLPYLMALVFWENVLIRRILLAASVLFGVSVLLGHIHYSIDVLSAFFITYTIFHIAERFFPGDRALFHDHPHAGRA